MIVSPPKVSEMTCGLLMRYRKLILPSRRGPTCQGQTQHRHMPAVPNPTNEGSYASLTYLSVGYMPLAGLQRRYEPPGVIGAGWERRAASESPISAQEGGDGRGTGDVSGGEPPLGRAPEVSG